MRLNGIEWQASGVGVMALALAMICVFPASSKATCENAQTQAEMNDCAARDYVSADSGLNQIYRKMAGQLSGSHRLALKKAQRAWVVYRDKACKSYGLIAEGGSMQSLLVYDCKSRLTKSRTEFLREHAKAIGPMTGSIE